MAGGQFWMSTTQQAAEVIYDGILRQKKIIYVTPRWALVAWLLKLLPTFLHERV
jgi:short-subunit dehydrogenase